MTGNKIAWRAPLAGLASLAMVATMGVAAGTASAAEATLTFHVGNNSAEYKESDARTVNGGQYDGKFSQAELQNVASQANAELNGKIAAGETFTGWFDSESYGTAATVLNGVADPAGTTETDLYAHSSKSVYTVNFNGSGVVNNAGPINLAFADDTLDTVPAWYVPTAEVSKTDGTIMYQKDGKTLAKGASWKAQGEDIDPTGNLYPAAFEEVSGNISTNATLTASPASSSVLVFHSQDANNGARTYTVKKQDGTPLNNFLEKNFEVAVDDTISNYVEFPIAVASGTPTFSTKTWYIGQAKTDAEFAQLKTLSDSDAMPTVSGKLDLYPGNATSGTEVTLHYNADVDGDGTVNDTKIDYAPTGSEYTPDEPGDVTTDNVVYSFAGWYTDAAFKKAYKPSTVATASDLYAKWDVASVRFTIEPGYGKQPAQDLWISNGDTFVLPTADELGREGWTFTWANQVWNTNSSFAVVVDNFTLYATGNGTADPAQTVTLKYLSTANKQKQQAYFGNGVSFHKLVPGDGFRAVNWVKNSDLKPTLRAMEQYVVVKNGGKYIKGSAQKDFTADSYDQYVKDFQAYIAADYKEKTVADLQAKIAKLAAIQAKLVEVGDADLYRAYNPNDGDHYFTKVKHEYETLVKLGWTAEGKRYTVVKDREQRDIDVAKGYVARHNFGDAVYSAYNPNTGEHLLVAQGEAEALAEVGWNNEGVKFYAPQGATEAVYRGYNPNATGPAHVYAAKGEVAAAVAAGWLWDNAGAPVYYFD